jgi:hypothetical protein
LPIGQPISIISINVGPKTTEHFSSRRIIVREVRAAHPGAGLLLRRWSKAKTR